MRLKLKSERLLDALQVAIDRSAGRKAGALLRASDNLDWVVFQEFGTATHFSADGMEGQAGITVEAPPPTHTPDGFYPTAGARLPVTPEFDEALIVPESHPEGKYLNRGVTPKGMIQTALPETLSPIAQIIANTLRDSDLSIDAVAAAMVEEAAPLVVRTVAERIGEVLGTTERDTPGKLGGASPAEAFASGVVIENLK